MQPGLRAILATIQPAPRENGPTQFIAQAIPGYESHYVAWDSRGAPCVLLHTSDTYFRAPLRLAGLEVQYAARCQIRLPIGTRADQLLTVVTCTAGDGATQDYFLHLMETVLRIVGASPSLAKVAEAIVNLVEILQQLARPAGRSAMGLFGELLVIATSAEPRVSLASWRAKMDDRFDFAIDNVRLETKATSDRVRGHYFSFEQCSPPVGTIGIVASMFVEQSGGGQSIAELVREIDERLADENELRLKLHSTIARSLGASLPDGIEMRFDVALARATLHFYNAADIPAIRSDIPRGVSQIRFRSDLTNVVPSSAEALRAKSTAVGLLLPR